jgi:hypothetical protein
VREFGTNKHRLGLGPPGLVCFISGLDRGRSKRDRRPLKSSSPSTTALWSLSEISKKFVAAWELHAGSGRCSAIGGS